MAIRVEPLPEGTTDFNWNEGGWDYVDDGEVLIYGNLASGNIEGTVTDQATNQPIARATVTTDKGGYSTLTDETGSFSLMRIKTDSYTLRVSAVGYQSAREKVSVTADSTQTVTIELGAGSEVCPSELILKNNPKELALLRKYRDTVLLKSDLGKQYVKSYYEHAAEMVKIILTNSAIREKVVTALAIVKPALESIMEGNRLALTKKQLAGIEVLTTALKPLASQRLRKTICQLENDLNNKAVNTRFTVAVSQ